MIDRRNALANRDLINNPMKLLYVLKKFYEIDEILLDQLQYYYLTTEKEMMQEETNDMGEFGEQLELLR